MAVSWKIQPFGNCNNTKDTISVNTVGWAAEWANDDTVIFRPQYITSETNSFTKLIDTTLQVSLYKEMILQRFINDRNSDKIYCIETAIITETELSQIKGLYRYKDKILFIGSICDSILENLYLKPTQDIVAIKIHKSDNYMFGENIDLYIKTYEDTKYGVIVTFGGKSIKTKPEKENHFRWFFEENR